MRGYQRKVIYLKNTGSAIFDEAYFVVNERADGVKGSADMVSEANRIIEENTGGKRRAARRFPTLREWIFFSVGLVGGALFALVLFMLF